MDLIFKPVFFIWFLSLTLIFVTTMQQLMGQGQTIDGMWGVNMSFTGNVSRIWVSNIADFEITENIFKWVTDEAKSMFVDLLVIVMTIFLLWKILKWSVEFGKWPVSDVMQKITPLIEDFATSLPIIPAAGGKYGIKALQAGSRAAKERAMKDIIGVNPKWRFEANEAAFKRQIETNLLGLPQSWEDKDYKKLQDLILHDEHQQFFSQFVDMGKTNQWGISLKTSKQKDLLEKWFKRVKMSADPRKVLADLWLPDTYTMISGDESLDDFFGKGKPDDDVYKIRRQRLHDKFGWNAAAHKGDSYTKPSYDDLFTTNEYYISKEK